jgi:peptide subunit release factor 1 (eRF1)
MGMLAPLAHLVSEVPKKVKGGVEGPEAKRVERHIDAVVLSHFKRAAKQTFDLFQKTEYAGLLVGCHNGTCGEFETVLHPYLKERLKGKLKAKPGDAPDKVLQECVALEKDLRKGEEDNLVARLLAEVEKGGRAVSGLRECLKRLNQGEVRELIVTRYFAAGGTSCPRCGLLYLDELRCPTCERKTVALLDVVDEAVQKAWERQCGVRHITPPSKLDRYGKIGVFLRYKA